jgi:hypothetical protein
MSRKHFPKWAVFLLLLVLIPALTVVAQGGAAQEQEGQTAVRTAGPVDFQEVPGTDNDTPEEADEIQCGWTVAGTIDEPGDVDYYVARPRYHDSFVAFTTAWEYGYPTDTTLTVFDNDGIRVLASNDDYDIRDSRLHWWTMAPLGYWNYYIKVEEYYGNGGADFNYELTF